MNDSIWQKIDPEPIKKPTKEQDALRVRMKGFDSYVITGPYVAPKLTSKESAAFYRPPPGLEGRLILA
jgi:hypothetical protein